MLVNVSWAPKSFKGLPEDLDLVSLFCFGVHGAFAADIREVGVWDHVDDTPDVICVIFSSVRSTKIGW